MDYVYAMNKPDDSATNTSREKYISFRKKTDNKTISWPLDLDYIIINLIPQDSFYALVLMFAFDCYTQILSQFYKRNCFIFERLQF